MRTEIWLCFLVAIFVVGFLSGSSISGSPDVILEKKTSPKEITPLEEQILQTISVDTPREYFSEAPDLMIPRENDIYVSIEREDNPFIQEKYCYILILGVEVGRYSEKPYVAYWELKGPSGPKLGSSKYMKALDLYKDFELMEKK